ncbi:MAG: cation acetate symporter, partial [Actinobacteria bacterium]|nr:cation acetate symporter [Actinomycetota bacterium]
MTAALGPGTGTETWGLLAVVLVTGAALAVGAFGMRFARTTSSFLVASRKVPPALNAAAISGEYLSAASFLGIAALVMQFGFTMLW